MTFLLWDTFVYWTGINGDGKLKVATFQKFLNEVQRDLLHIEFLRKAHTVDGEVVISAISLAEMLLHDANVNPSNIPAFRARVKSHYGKETVSCVGSRKELDRCFRRNIPLPFSEPPFSHTLRMSLLYLSPVSAVGSLQLR